MMHNCLEADKCQQPTQGRMYSITKNDADTNASIMAGTILLQGFNEHALFNLGVTHSFMSR